MAANFVRFVDAGIDWLTVTISGHDTMESLAPTLQSIIDEQLSFGERKRPWGMSGFSGYSAGHLEFGVRGPTLLVRLHSVAAYKHWPTFLEVADNCSRIDLQVTVEYDCEPAKVIAAHYRQIKKFRQGKSHAPKLRLFKDADGPATLYLGQRISDRFSRIYDKQAESGLEHYRGAVRYEIEIKNDLAQIYAARLAKSVHVQPDIISQVLSSFSERGARLWWPTPALQEYPCPRSRSTACKRLAWLTDSVRVAIHDLIASGYMKEVYAALALPEPTLAHVGQPEALAHDYTGGH